MKPWAKANVQFIAKGLPKTHIGLCQERYQIGEDYIDLEHLLYDLVCVASQFYARTMEHVPVEEINTSIRLAGEAITRLYLKEET